MPTTFSFWTRQADPDRHSASRLRRDSPGSPIVSSASIFWRRWRSWPTATATRRADARLHRRHPGRYRQRTAAAPHMPQPCSPSTFTCMRARSGVRPRSTAHGRKEPRERRSTSGHRACSTHAPHRRGTALQPTSHWLDYYDATNYSEAPDKERIVTAMLERVRRPPGILARTRALQPHRGRQAIPTVAFDLDAAAVERNYREMVRTKDESLLPSVLDLTNPSAGVGWAGTERIVPDRGPASLRLRSRLSTTSRSATMCHSP